MLVRKKTFYTLFCALGLAGLENKSSSTSSPPNPRGSLAVDGEAAVTFTVSGFGFGVD